MGSERYLMEVDRAVKDGEVYAKESGWGIVVHLGGV